MPEERVSLQVAISSTKAVQGSKEVVSSTDRIKRGANEAHKSVATLEKQFISLRGASRALIGPVGTLFGALTATRGLTASVKAIASFETTLATLQGVARASAEEVVALEESARSFGASTRFSATQAGEGLTFLARAGFTTTESINALGATLNLAAAGNLDLGTAADFASNIVSQFGVSAEDTVRVVDDLVIVSNRANTNVQQLASAMSFVGPIASALGISMEEASAAVGALGDVGVQSTRAGRGLRGVMLSLASPTTEAQKIFKKLNVDIESLNPATQSLESLLTRLADANLSVADSARVFGRENVVAAVALGSAKDRVVELTKAQEDYRGEAQKLATIQDDTLTGSYLRLQSSASELALKLGDKGLKASLRDTVEFSIQVADALGGASSQMNEVSTSADIVASQIEALTIAAGTLVALNLVTHVTKLRGAVLALNAAIAANPVGAFAVGTSVLVGQIIALNTATEDQIALVEELKRKEIDLQLTRESFKGVSGAINFAFEIGDPEIIESAFKRLRATVKQQTEVLLEDSSNGGVDITKLLGFIPENVSDSISGPLKRVFDEASEELKKEREALLDNISFNERAINRFRTLINEDLGGGGGGFGSKALSQRRAEVERLTENIKRYRAQLETLDKPLSDPKQTANALIETLQLLDTEIDSVSKSVLDSASSKDNAKSFIVDPKDVLRTIDSVSQLREELNRTIVLASKSDSEVMQLENGYRALAASANLPLVQRLAFLSEVVVKTKELQTIQRDIGAGDILRAEQDSLEILMLRTRGLDVEAEMLQREINLRQQGIELTVSEKDALRELIVERANLQKSLESADTLNGVQSLFADLAFERELIGLTNDERERAIELKKLETLAVKAQLPNSEELVEQYKKELAELQKLQQLEQLGSNAGNSVGSALEDIAFGAKEAGDAIEDLYEQVAKLFFREFVTNQIAGFLGSSLPGLFSGGTNANGNVYQGGWQTRMARGDILTGPTILPAANGPALGGEAGPEAIVPLGRDSQGRLGLRDTSKKSNGGNVTINMTFPNVTNAVDFERSMRQNEQRLARAINRNNGG